MEKFITYLLSAIACIILWLAVCFIMALLKMEFRIWPFILLMAVLLPLCRWIKKKVHEAYSKKDHPEQ